MKKIILLLFVTICFAQDATRIEKYQITVKDKTYLINKSENKLSWRLVYREKTVLWLFESNGYTFTKDSLIVCKSKDECLKIIDNLDLKYDERIGNQLIVIN